MPASIVDELLDAPEGSAQSGSVGASVVDELLGDSVGEGQFDRIGGTYQPAPSPIPGGGTPVSAITGRQQKVFVPGAEPGAGVGPMIKAGYADDPVSMIKIYAKARGISPARYQIKDGEIIFRNVRGEWQREVSELPISRLQRGVVQGITHPSTALGTVGAMAGGVLGAGAGAAAGEVVRKGVSKLAYGEKVKPVRDLVDVGIEGLLGMGGEMVGKVLVGATNRYIGRKGKLLRYSGFDPSRSGMQDHARAVFVKSLAEQHGLDLAPHQIYNKESMTNVWKYLRKHPYTSDAIREFDERLADQTDEAVRGFIREMGGFSESGYARGLNLQKSSEKIIEKMEARRQGLISPTYRQAFQEAYDAGGVELQSVLDHIDDLMEGWDPSPERRILADIKNRLTVDKPIETPGQLKSAHVIAGEGDRWRIIKIKSDAEGTGGRWIADIDEDMESGLRGLIDDVSRGEPGGRVFNEPEPGTGGGADVTGFASTYPDFMRDQGWTRVEVMQALDLAVKKQPMGVRQSQIVEAALGHLEEMERSAFDFFDELATTAIEERPPAEALTQAFDKPERVLTEKVPERELVRIQKTLFHINDLIDGTSKKATDITPSGKSHLTRDLAKVKAAILGEVKKVSPSFIRANEEWGIMSKPIDELRRSVIGELANLRKDSTIAKATEKLMNQPDDILLVRAKDLIEPRDPRAWRRLVGGYIADTYQGMSVTQEGERGVINLAGKMYKNLYGTPAKRRLMKAMMPDAKTARAFEDLMLLMKHASIGWAKESGTAPLQETGKILEKKLGSKAYKMFDLRLSQLREWTLGRWNEMQISQNADKLFEQLIAPDNLVRMKHLKRLNPRGRKFLEGFTVLTALMLGTGVQSETTPRLQASHRQELGIR